MSLGYAILITLAMYAVLFAIPLLFCRRDRWAESSRAWDAEDDRLEQAARIPPKGD